MNSDLTVAALDMHPFFCYYCNQGVVSRPPPLIYILPCFAPLRWGLHIIWDIPLSLVVGFRNETVSLAREICTIFLDVQIALFGCIFAVCSILLAFLSDDYVKKLLTIDYYNQSSYLRKSTRYYEAALFIYFVSIIMSLGMKVTLVCIPENFLLFSNMLANELLASLLLAGYFVFSIRVIFELKSVVGNTLLLFRSSIAFKIFLFYREEKASVENKSDVH